MTITFPKLTLQEEQNGLQKQMIDWNKSTKQYFDDLNPKYIAWDFYKQYIDVEPPFGQLGLPVFLRTYSRYIPFLNRREKWCETVLRNVEFNIGLDKKTSFEKLKEEAENLFDYIFNLKTFPSGRSLWTAGTSQTEADPSSTWNCVFRTIDSISSYGEIFYWLLIGAGCGYSVEKQFIDKLPNFYNKKVKRNWLKKLHDKLPTLCKLTKNKNVKHINFVNDNWIPGNDDTLIFVNNFYVKSLSYKHYLTGSDDFYYNLLSTINEDVSNVEIIVGDSKEGWVTALRMYLTLLTYDKGMSITFNYKNVRPAGVPLKRFGGVATGCKNFIRMIDQINFVLDNVNGKLNSNQAMDLVGIIALCVVSGNIRRSATIALGDKNDEMFKTAKFNLWTDDEMTPYRQFRVMSNNSIVVDEKLTFEELQNVFEKIKSNGEPGFYVRSNARRYDDQIVGTNPCVEASLRNRQSCNLTTNNVYAFVRYDENNNVYFDEEGWRKSLYLSTRIGSRVTTLPQWHYEWDKIQKSQRLLGVSMTGLMDAVDALGWNEEEVEAFKRRSSRYVREVADQYHAELGIERSARVTLTKPEGSLSQLPTVSSGVHRGYAPQYIRRVRFSSVDPLAKALLDVFGEDKVFPENGQGESLYDENVDTWVFSFPIKTKAKIRAIDEPALSQLERYKQMQTCYTADGHNTSITVTVAPDEWDDVVKWVYDNWNCVIGLSFLPKYDPEVETYPQMPYEPCDVKTYEELKNVMPTFTENKLIELITKYEKSNKEYEILDEACAKNFCPVR